MSYFLGNFERLVFPSQAATSDPTAEEDIVTIIQDNIVAANVDNIVPTIEFVEGDDDDPPHPTVHYSRAILFKEVEDHIEDLGIARTHQDEGSKDVFICYCIDQNIAGARKLRDEVRRICRAFEGNGIYNWLDWLDAQKGGISHRRMLTFVVECYRAGKAYT